MASTIQTPEWVKDAVFYQIFPDRFAKSDRVSKPSNLQAWGAQPTNHGYQGGDLLGVAEHLDYLVDLGINAIYFTPIFQSASNHRYHTHDYMHVDPILGGDAAFRTLIEEAHKRQIRVVLDGVFNHASRGFFQFNDLLENGPESPWVDWFTVEKWPINPYNSKYPSNYLAWWGNPALPRLKTENPQVREFVMQIAEYWLREYNIDGWRLDVPTEITAEGFWEEFRRRVKTIRPDAYVVGEIWSEARDWLQGNRFDATMNYVFAAAAIAFAGGKRVSQAQVVGRSYDPYPGIGAEAFGERISNLLALYDWEVTQSQLNLLASHDTARVTSIVRGDRSTLRLATLLQMTYPGAPSVYYGDEICLRGGYDYDQPFRDTDARWAFPWQDRTQWDIEMFDYFKRLIALRREHKALRRGQISQVYAQGDCFAWARHDESEKLIMCVNAGTSAQKVTLPVSTYFADGSESQVLFGAPTIGPVSGGTMLVTLPARSGCIFGQTMS